MRYSLKLTVLITVLQKNSGPDHRFALPVYVGWILSEASMSDFGYSFGLRASWW